MGSFRWGWSLGCPMWFECSRVIVGRFVVGVGLVRTIASVVLCMLLCAYICCT